MFIAHKWNQTIVSDRPHFGYTDLDGRISKWPYLDEDINIRKCQLPFFHVYEVFRCHWKTDKGTVEEMEITVQATENESNK